MHERILELNRRINAERDSEKISALLEQLRKEIAEERARIETTQLSNMSTP